MQDKFAPSRLTVDGGNVEVSLLFESCHDCVQVGEVVGSPCFGRGLEHQVLFQGHVAPDKAVPQVFLVFSNGLVRQLQVLPGFLYLLAWGGCLGVVE